MLTPKEFIEVETEIKDTVKRFFKQHDDTFGYVTDKLSKIDNLAFGEAHLAFRMMHEVIRRATYPALSDEAQIYLTGNGYIYKQYSWE